MVARRIKNLGSALNHLQNMINQLVINWRPVPTILESPTIQKITYEIKPLGLVLAEKLQAGFSTREFESQVLIADEDTANPLLRCSGRVVHKLDDYLVVGLQGTILFHFAASVDAQIRGNVAIQALIRIDGESIGASLRGELNGGSPSGFTVVKSGDRRGLEWNARINTPKKESSRPVTTAAA